MGGPGRINQSYAACLASVSARKNVELYSSILQQFAQQYHERCLAGTADGQVANTDHRPAQAPGTENPPVVERIPGPHACAVDATEQGKTRETHCGSVARPPSLS